MSAKDPTRAPLPIGEKPAASPVPPPPYASEAAFGLGMARAADRQIDRERQALVDALRKLQWASCDGCAHGRESSMNFCPICGAEKNPPDQDGAPRFGQGEHGADCWLGKLLKENK